MNNKYRLICFLMIITTFLLFSTCFSYADSDNTKAKLYEIEFNNEPHLCDSKVNSLINNQDIKIEEISFKINTPDDLITLGYNSGSEEFKLDNMRSDLEYALEIKYNDKTLPEHYELDSLPIDKINFTICNNSNVSNEESILGLSEEDGVIREIVNKVDLCKESGSQSLSVNSVDLNTRSYTIDGSYHYTTLDNNIERRKWHNQSTGNNSTCNRTASKPHAGDGNSRHKDGFQWFPNKIKAKFTVNKETSPVYKNSTRLSYYYYQSALNNLKHDSNETLEMEVIFYNYPNETNNSNKGLAFQKRSSITYLTNQPNAYLDTGLFDTCPCFCVGVNDASSLVAKKWYYWEIISKKGDKNGYPNDGRFRINAQRGYRYLSSGALGIFSEEHERTIAYGKTSSQNWVPSVNAWTLANNNTTWTCNTTDGPISW